MGKAFHLQRDSFYNGSQGTEWWECWGAIFGDGDGCRSLLGLGVLWMMVGSGGGENLRQRNWKGGVGAWFGHPIFLLFFSKGQDVLTQKAIEFLRLSWNYQSTWNEIYLFIFNVLHNSVMLWHISDTRQLEFNFIQNFSTHQ